MQNKTSISDRAVYNITKILVGLGIGLAILLTFVKIWTGSIFHQNGVNMRELIIVFIMDIVIMSICISLAAVWVHYIKEKAKKE